MTYTPRHANTYEPKHYGGSTDLNGLTDKLPHGVPIGGRHRATPIDAEKENPAK